MNLSELVQSAQSGGETAVLQLLSLFKQALRRYAYYLHTEDAYYDLQADFIDVIHKMNLSNLACREDAVVAGYLLKAIKYSYLRHAKRQKRRIGCELLSPILEEGESLQFPPVVPAPPDQYPGLLLTDIWSSVSKSEFAVIYQHFFLGIQISDIAKRQHISRQAVNKLKNSGLKRLAQEFEDSQ